MKRGLKVFIGLACLLVIGLPVAAQPSSRSIETFVIDTFDSESDQNYMYNGNSYNWSWSVNTSRYIASDYPKMGYYEGCPNSLKVLRKGDPTPAQVLGVKTRFNRKGDNWFEIYPEADGKPFEVPFVGNVTTLDFWVWGANYNYYLEILLRDATGRVHVLKAGTLAFNGWRNIIVNVPGYIQQHSHLRSGPENLVFVGFRVRTDPQEYVDNFVIFFDQFKYTTNALSFVYDGYELKDVTFEDDSSERNGK
ncbi:MAG: flagellar filament protein FlaA [Treponema sp.]|nr:flagellar filament protein FlaA [Treponema sp.]